MGRCSNFNTLRKELRILDLSRKKPDSWALTFEVLKFARHLKNRVMVSKSYLSYVLCCRSNVGSEYMYSDDDSDLSRRLSELSDLSDSDTSFSELSEADLLSI